MIFKEDYNKLEDNLYILINTDKNGPATLTYKEYSNLPSEGEPYRLEAPGASSDRSLMDSLKAANEGTFGGVAPGTIKWFNWNELNPPGDENYKFEFIAAEDHSNKQSQLLDFFAPTQGPIIWLATGNKQKIGSNGTTNTSGKVPDNASKKKLINQIIKKAKVSSILALAYNYWHAKDGYFLVMCPLDNDPVLEKYIFRAKDFLSLLKEFQKKYQIYKYGWNIFVDGNVMYLMNKKTPNKIDFLNDWTYCFHIVDTTSYLTGGHIPLTLDDGAKRIEIVVDVSQVKFYGHFVDTQLDQKVALAMESGKLLLDNGAPPSDSIFVSVEGDEYSLKQINEMKPSKENPDPLSIYRKDIRYSIVSITLNNSFLTFVPGDNIEITDGTKKGFLWQGTVKRWASQQTNLKRGVYLIAVGAEAQANSTIGNGILGGLMKGLGKLKGLPALKGKVTNVANKINKVLDLPKSIMKDAKNLPSLLEKYAPKVGNEIFNRATDITAGWLQDRIGRTMGPEAFNKLVNFGIAAYNSPNLRGLLNWGINSIRNYRQNAMLSYRLSEALESLDATEDYIEIEVLEEDYVEIADNSKDWSKRDFYILKDGFDKAVNSRIYKDLLDKVGPIYDLIKSKKLGLTEEEIELIRDFLLTDTNGYNLKVRTECKGLHKYILMIRDFYLANVLDDMNEANMSKVYNAVDKTKGKFTINNKEYTLDSYMHIVLSADDKLYKNIEKTLAEAEKKLKEKIKKDKAGDK